MPIISQFLGIVIIMFWNDHNSHEFIIYINDDTIEGRFPKRALRLVLEWYELHKNALIENWKLAESYKALLMIPPLE